MATSQATSGYGALLKRGDGGAGAGTKASRTMGTTDSQLVIKWGEVGTAGNSKTCSVVVSGNNTPLSVVVTSSAVMINAETNGSAVSISTVNDVIAKLYQDATFVQSWEANDGVGDGTGVIAAASSASLSGGAAGGEVFATIAEVTSISGPNRSREMIEVTHMESPGGYREYLPSIKDGGSVSFDLNFLPGDSSQQGLISDLDNGTIRNFQLIFTDASTTTYEFAGYVESFEITSSPDEALTASCSIKLTGDITIS